MSFGITVNSGRLESTTLLHFVKSTGQIAVNVIQTWGNRFRNCFYSVGLGL